jgi:hypothetical protein
MTCCSENNDGEPVYQCQKYQVAMCPACLKCRDPKLYCKFRSSCLIHFLEKEHQDLAGRQ